MKMHRSIFAIILSLLPCSCVSSSALAQDAPMHTTIALPIRASSQIAPPDAATISARTADISRAAAFYGYSVDSSWSYDQAVCPLASQHILLNYWNTGTEGASRFSAVVPREGGVVRIVPLVRAGTAPFVAPWSEHSYAVFNAITAGNPGLKKSNVDLSSGDAFLRGLCYVALVGEQGIVRNPNRDLGVISATEPTLRTGTRGEVSLSFTVQDDIRNYSVWNLSFSLQGALVHASREQHPLVDAGLRMAAIAQPSRSPAPTTVQSPDLVQDSAQPHPSPSATHPSAAPSGMSQSSTSQSGISQSAMSQSNMTQPVESSPVEAASPAGQPSAAQSEAAMTPASAQPAPASRRQRARSEIHAIPETPMRPSRPIPDGPAQVSRPVPETAPLSSRPVPQS